MPKKRKNILDIWKSDNKYVNILRFYLTHILSYYLDSKSVDILFKCSVTFEPVDHSNVWNALEAKSQINFYV